MALAPPPHLPPSSEGLSALGGARPLKSAVKPVLSSLRSFLSSCHPFYRKSFASFFNIKICLSYNPNLETLSDDVLQIHEKLNTNHPREQPSNGGFHLIVLHPLDGKIMSRSHFRTSQPGESRILAKAMARILPGRLFILICLVSSFLLRQSIYLRPNVHSLFISCFLTFDYYYFVKFPYYLSPLMRVLV